MTQIHDNPKEDLKQRFKIALSWCLAWGEAKESAYPLDILNAMRDAIDTPEKTPPEIQNIVGQVAALQAIPNEAKPQTIEELKEIAKNIIHQQTKIGLVYGGVTKVKQYVFESANLMEIRGASAILDRINLIDLPAFFGKQKGDLDNYHSPRQWLKKEYPQLLDSLIPELIIYSTGGNILAFCPAAYVDDLANAIEKRYTTETLTANSCAVGDTFRLLEIRFGILNENIDSTPWFDWYQKNAKEPLVEAYFGKVEDDTELLDKFFDRKSFNELAGKLAVRFNQRRSGNKSPNRPSRCYPPMLETHPYLVRDGSDRASATLHIQPDNSNESLARESWFSEPVARKYIMGQRTKRDDRRQGWYESSEFSDWNPGYIKSWVTKFQDYLEEVFEDTIKQQKRKELRKKYYSELPNGLNIEQVEQSRSVEEIANASNNFLSYIYADGNNMGGYIQTIKTPEQYRQFSKDIFEATEQSVYYALAQNLHPHQLKNLKKPEAKNRNGQWVHPFEIITIGGDDVLIIVPANQALAIAKDIGEKFEEILEATGNYPISSTPNSNPKNTSQIHRYLKNIPQETNSCLSTSMGVLTVSYNTPIYYAQNLTNQLLKSAKKKAKKLKKDCNYHGGTVDILALKSVTMISSNIEEFRNEGLTIKGKPELKLYASPYTLHELGGLIETIQALKEVDFPRSQLYQIRSLLERGKRTAMLNYHYFRARLKPENAKLLNELFEQTWCQPKEYDNYGTLAPWMSIKESGKPTIYETIWREIVDYYPFIESDPDSVNDSQQTQETTP